MRNATWVLVLTISLALGLGCDSGDDDGYCNACFTGNYPLAVGDAQAKLAFEGVLH